MKMEKNAAIYIAGSHGVAGSAIARMLKKEGYENLLLPTHNELDLRDQDSVEAFFSEKKPEYVFFAAVKMGSVVYRREHPAEILSDNLLMQTNVLRAAHEHGVKKLLFMSSDFVYPDTEDGVLREEDLLSGPLGEKDLPYKLAKLAGIKLCDFYREQYGDDFFTVVPCAFFGENSSFEPQRASVVCSLIQRFDEAKRMGAKELVLWGSGKPVKEFLLSDDIASACLCLMEKHTGGGIVNIGSGDGGTSILQAAQVIRSVVGFAGEIGFDLSKPDGVMRRVMDSSRLRALGWQPAYCFEEAVQRTYQYFMKTEAGR